MTVLLRRWWTRGRRQVRRVVRLIGRPFRRSVQLRLLATAISISVISLALLTVYLSVAMRDGLVDRRVEEILSESARSLSQTQTTVNSSTASSSSGVQQTLNDLLPALQSGERLVVKCFFCVRRPIPLLCGCWICRLPRTQRGSFLMRCAKQLPKNRNSSIGSLCAWNRGAGCCGGLSC